MSRRGFERLLGWTTAPANDELPVVLALVTPIEAAERLAELANTLSSIETVLDIPAMRASIADLEEQASAPDLWDDQVKAQAVTSKLSFQLGDLRRVEGLRRRLDDVPILLELAEAEGDEASTAEAMKELDALKIAIDELEVRTLLSGEYDAREALVTIRSEAGGVDAADWAEMLLRMYTRYCERHGWPVDVYETSYAEEAGIKSATFAVKAPYAYGTLSVEQGTHRLVRISPFDNQGRRQTSFAGVEVIPVVEQAETADIPDDDLRVDVYRSSGPGGQGVNTTDSAASWFLAKTSAPRFKIRQQPWWCCRPSCWKSSVKKTGPRWMPSRGITQALGGIRCAPTCCTPIKWSRTYARKPKPETPQVCLTVRSTSSWSPVSGGVSSKHRRVLKAQAPTLHR